MYVIAAAASIRDIIETCCSCRWLAALIRLLLFWFSSNVIGMSSRRQFYLFFFFLFHLFFQWVTVGLCPCPVRRTVRASKAVKRVTSSVTYRYRPCFPPSSSAVTPPTSSPTSSVYFSHLFSLRESPTFSSISSDNSFEPLDAFT